MVEYTYQKSPVDLGLLTAQINASSSIGQDVSYINGVGEDSISIFFENELSEAEQTALAAIVTAHDASQGGQYQATHLKESYTKSKLMKEEWFETCDAQGVMSGLSKANEYTWSGNTLMSRLEKQYFTGGVVSEQHIYNYITVDGNRVERKVS